MTKRAETLEELRQDIDEIDDAIHDLIMRRAEIVGRIHTFKDGSIQLRPAREAAILRRLTARHRGRFPRQAVLQIWRQILSAMVGIQGPFSLAVSTNDPTRDYGALARSEYGAATPLQIYASPAEVVRAVADGTAVLGILPPPAPDETEPWWPLLVQAETSTAKIAARLPFARFPECGTQVEALAIARLDQIESGRDRSLLILAAANELERPEREEWLRAAGLPLRFGASRFDDTQESTWLYLAEIDEFVGPEDARTERLADLAAGAIERVFVVGGYAVPIETDDKSAIAAVGGRE